MKIRSEEAEFFRAHKRNDMTKLKVALRNFANAPKTVSLKIMNMKSTHHNSFQSLF